MSGMIKITGSNNEKNHLPTIKNLRTDGVIKPTEFTIKYTAEDFENTILRHYIYIDNQKKEVTKEVGYESPNNEFSYKLDNLKYYTLYEIKIEVSDGVNVVQSNLLQVRTENATVYGVKIMENNSNPETCCAYTDNAVGFSVANSTSLGNWQDKFPFKNMRIVGFKNGKVIKAINPNNKTLYVDGTTVPSDVDIMIEIPKIYWKVDTITNGYEIKISNVKTDGSYDCYAHKVNGIEKNFIYIGAYLGYVENGKLRSRSGVSPTIGKSLSEFRTYAKANGSGYQQLSWFPFNLIRILFLIAFKNLNCQLALGNGVSKSNNKKNTGGTNTKGWIYGTTANTTDQVCFLGIEDVYGNLGQFVDGIYVDSNTTVKVLMDNNSFNDDYKNYESVGSSASMISGYVDTVNRNSTALFFPKTARGSESTHYCDYTLVRQGFCGTFGGDNQGDRYNGLFNTEFNYYPSTQIGNGASRLCYLG